MQVAQENCSGLNAVGCAPTNRSAKYGSAYESARFSHNTADGITMVGVGCIAGLVRRGAQGVRCRWQMRPG